MSILVPSATQLGLAPTLRFSAAPANKTFYYSKRRKEQHGGHLPVIDSDWEDSLRFRRTSGPFIYAVVDSSDRVRYIGKSWEDYLHQRWLRPQPNIHHRESRDFILAELIASRGPLHLWSATSSELKRRVPAHASMEDRLFTKAVEALWLHRWLPQLWNHKLEALVPDFSDYEYWKQ